MYAFTQMGYDCGVDTKELKEINDYFLPIKNKFTDNGLFDPYVLSTKTDALVYQIPGGMLSNLVAQLKAQNAIDKLDRVLEETPRVRADLGYPPACHAALADGRRTGDRERAARRAVQVHRQGDQELYPRRIRPRARQGKRRACGEGARRRQADYRTLRRFARAGVPGGARASRPRARSEEDVLSYIAFPQQAEQFFTRREQTFTASYSFKEVK